MSQFRITLAAALIALSAAAHPALAADRQVDTVQVGYADLNLSSKAGVDALRHRLIAASRDVCGGEQACRIAALADALRDMRRIVASVPPPHELAVASATPN